MEVLRTPDERFAALPGWDHEPVYTDVPRGDGSGVLRVHHVDVGPADADPVLCLHGEPSWGYLYRKMIPVLVDAGLRAVVPDLVGFGRSDKPAARDDYTYQRHVDWMAAWLQAVDLQHVTLVCQDWGGLIGLRLAAEHPERFDRLVVANTFLPIGDRPAGEAFLAWRTYSQEAPSFNIGRIVEGGSASRPIGADVVAAYDAPFPDDAYKAGARQFPVLVPISPDDPASEANRRAWGVLDAWTKPVLTAFGDSDPITAGADRVFQARVPGAKGMPHTTIVGGGHFLQEDRGEELAAAVVDFIRATPAGSGAVAEAFTPFLPSRDGFGFANDFPSVPAKVVDLVVTQVPIGDASNGLCGGMVYAALDYFLEGRPPPAGTVAPGGGPLFDYLVDRLIDSWRASGLNGLPAGATYFHLMSSTVPDAEQWWTRFSPWHSRAWVMAKQAWPAVKADVDAGRPSPLGLIRVLTWDVGQLGRHHQVLVWGYRQQGSSLTLWVYDPNRPGDDTVRLDLDVGRISRKIDVVRTPPSNHPIHCFFRPGYERRTPPI